MNSWRIGLSAVAMTFLACASASAAELDGTWKPPPVGTITLQVVLSGDFAWEIRNEVVGVQGDYVHFKGDRTSALKDIRWSSCRGLLPTISGDGTERRFDCGAIAALFPLKVGNKSRFDASEDRRGFRVMYRVASVEEVKTLVGIRSVFRIKYHVVANDGRFAQRGTIYFDPALGIGQQGSFITDKGRGGSAIWELDELELPN